MAEILIENLDDAIIARLTEHASEQGLSLEESVRRILTTEATKMSKAMWRIREDRNPR